MRYNMLIVGVGGQGILLVSDILSKAALKQDLYVKKSETHGMAQRGGSVMTHVRFSDREVCSPLIPKGSADMILAFEPLEALRYLDYLGEDFKLIVNKNQVASNVRDYPPIEEILEILEKQENTILVDAKKLSLEAGHPLTQNIIMLGVASRHIPLKEGILRETIKKTVKKALKENLKAFDLGSTLC
jgi:indolepyruvate ferredoxin oxidoreductase beta subunit